MTKRENPVLQLEERIWRKSNGMCTAGSGPYGIGGSSVSKEIGFYLEFTPNPFEDEMKDDDCCSIRVCAFFKDDSLVQRTLIESKDYPALMES